jgi:dTDP-4-amino-4,6-dideoxygalactose transaminase
MNVTQDAMLDPAAEDAIPLIDLAAQRRRLGGQIEAAVSAVIESDHYIMGQQIIEFERKLADFVGIAHAISCSSGTDALALVLKARGIKPGDAVICPSFTFCATAEVVVWLGATPVFAEVREEDFNIDPRSFERAIATAKREGLVPKAVIPVDLFGVPADYPAITPMAEAEHMFVLADAAQSLGGSLDNQKVGCFGLATATSFFPSKPLGCYGDGGAVLTDDSDLAMLVKSLRVHGQGTHKYDNVRIGMASRLDTIQAAVLLPKLSILAEEIEARENVARRYANLIDGFFITPRVHVAARPAWAHYTLRIPNGRRNLVAAHLKRRNVASAVYYPKGLHQQTAYQDYPVAEGGLAVTERIVDEVLSLPMHPYLGESAQNRIMAALRETVS